MSEPVRYKTTRNNKLTLLREDSHIMVTSRRLVLARKERWSGCVGTDFEIKGPSGHGEVNKRNIKS